MSHWLTVLLITDFQLKLFWDSVRLHFGWKITNLRKTYPWRNKFDIQYSISCNKDHFLSIRHNHLQDLTENIMSNLCRDTHRFLEQGQHAIFQLDNVLLQQLRLLQNTPPAVPCYEWTCNETSVKWNDILNWPWYTYTPGISNE